MNYKFDMQPRNKCNRSALLSADSTGGHAQTLKCTKSTSLSLSLPLDNLFMVRRHPNANIFVVHILRVGRLVHYNFFAPFAIICSLKYGLDQE